MRLLVLVVACLACKVRVRRALSLNDLSRGNGDPSQGCHFQDHRRSRGDSASAEHPKAIVRRAGEGAYTSSRSLAVLLNLVNPGAVSRRAGGSRSAAGGTATCEVDTLIFDIDDTLYPASSGFSDHRMGNITARFMVEQLGFQSQDEALQVWTEYIKRYHSTLKGLQVATAEGNLPRPFREEELGKYWADHCDFATFLARDDELIYALESLQASGLKLVAFSNAPRSYALRVLANLGLRRFFSRQSSFWCGRCSTRL
jgi:putative hydrolase of the HAD superfamily